MAESFEQELATEIANLIRQHVAAAAKRLEDKFLEQIAASEKRLQDRLTQIEKRIGVLEKNFAPSFVGGLSGHARELN